MLGAFREKLIMENDILVSVGVITYNSSKYVLETLESIKAQTYQNIELIISDDCSTDNTIEICRKWIESNKERFQRTEIIIVPQNTGIPANCNRFIKASQGEWIKLIAGDDLLLPNCIEDNVSYVEKKSDTIIVFSKQKNFKSKDGQNIYLADNPGPNEISFYDKPVEEQFRMLLERNYIWIAPTSFIKTLFLKDNNYDEKFSGMEDYPMWIKLTKNGVQLPLMNSLTVLYRCSESITRPVENFYTSKYMESQRLFYYLELKKYFTNEYKSIDEQWKMRLFHYDLCMFLFKNKKTLINKILNRFFCFVIFHNNIK